MRFSLLERPEFRSESEFKPAKLAAGGSKMETTVKSASSDQKTVLISTIAAAFVTDPVARWLLPEAHRYFSCVDEFVDAFAGAAFVHGSAYYVDGYCGAALWLPPGVQPNEEKMMTILKDAVPTDRLDA